MANNDAVQRSAELAKAQLANVLGGVRLETCTDPLANLSREERIAKAAQALQLLPNLEPVIRFLTAEQTIMIAREAQNMDFVWFGRGNLNFADVLLTYYRKLAEEYKSFVQDNNVKPTDPYNPAPTIQ